MTTATLIDALKSLLEPGKLLTDSDSLNTYGKDWTKHFAPKPLAIAFPKSIEQVQAIVRWANQHQVALVPSGGRTGLSAGAVAANGEVVVAFDYMNQILEFNEFDRTARCQAGVVTKQLQQFAEEHGLYYPVDFASSGSSQIGGNIGTNAGGIKVIRYGMTRNWVAGMTVVTGKGEVLELNRDLIKNATGYDLRQLFIGAEGTLGFVVEATMRLDRAPKNLTAMVLGAPDLDSIMPVLHAFQSKLDLTAFEFFSDKALAKILARGDVPAPFDTECPFYALLEFEASTEEVAAVLAAINANGKKQVPLDAAITIKMIQNVLIGLVAFAPWKGVPPPPNPKGTAANPREIRKVIELKFSRQTTSIEQIIDCGFPPAFSTWKLVEGHDAATRLQVQLTPEGNQLRVTATEKQVTGMVVHLDVKIEVHASDRPIAPEGT